MESETCVVSAIRLKTSFLYCKFTFYLFSLFYMQNILFLPIIAFVNGLGKILCTVCTINKNPKVSNHLIGKFMTKRVSQLCSKMLKPIIASIKSSHLEH